MHYQHMMDSLIYLLNRVIIFASLTCNKSLYMTHTFQNSTDIHTTLNVCPKLIVFAGKTFIFEIEKAQTYEK